MSEISKEYVIIDNTNYEAIVMTEIDSIVFTTSDISISDAVEKFSNVTELEVAGEDLKPYGIYKNLTFTSATIDSNNLVTIKFHIVNDLEQRIAKLETTQAEQDIAISKLVFGGEE